jgi:hypothetical protein
LAPALRFFQVEAHTKRIVDLFFFLKQEEYLHIQEKKIWRTTGSAPSFAIMRGNKWSVHIHGGLQNCSVFIRKNRRVKKCSHS